MPRSVTNNPAWKPSALVAALILSACGPGYAPAGVSLVVRSPPRDRVEVRGEPPGPGYIWIGGYYGWDGGNYSWISGRWERPPQPIYRTWVPGRWVRVRGGWYWIEGHWR